MAGVALAVLAAACVESAVCWNVLSTAGTARRGEAEMRRYATRAARVNRTIFLREHASPALRGLSGEEQDELAGAPLSLAGLLPEPPR